ncbi:MAG: hypothetical protein ACO2ZP_03940 [Bacteriovoracaceae bacterium]
MIKISAQLSSFLDRCDEQQKKAIVSYFDELIDEFNNKRDLMGERGSVIHFMKKMEECVEKFINKLLKSRINIFILSIIFLYVVK